MKCCSCYLLLLVVFIIASCTNENNADEPVIIPNSCLWTCAGPFDVGGRTTALMYDPIVTSRKKVWAGTFGGGLWYTDDITDEEEPWIPVPISGSYKISCMTFNPANRSQYYVGTGNFFANEEYPFRGTGLYMSANAGASFNPITSTLDNPDFEFVNAISVDTTGQRLYVATSEGLFSSDYNGDTWDVEIDSFISDVEVLPGGVILASSGNAGRLNIHRKTLAGSWELVFVPHCVPGTYNCHARRSLLTYAPSNPQIVYAIRAFGGIAELYQSSDAGLNWEVINFNLLPDVTCTHQPHQNLALVAHPVDSSVVFAGLVCLMKWRCPSSNCGWTEELGTRDPPIGIYNDIHSIAIRKVNFQGNIQMVIGTDGGVFLVEHNGVDYTTLERNKGFSTTLNYQVGVDDSEMKFVVATLDRQGIAFDEDTFITLAVPASGPIGLDSRYAFYDGQHDMVMVSSASGADYTMYYDTPDTSIGFPSKELGIGTYAYGNFWGCLDNGTRLRHTIFLERFTQNIQRDYEFDGVDGAFSTIGFSPKDGKSILVGTTTGKLYRINDVDTRNPVLQAIDIPGAPATKIASISISEDINDILVLFDEGPDQVWHTNDGGQSWRNKTFNLEGVAAEVIMHDPDNPESVAYIGTYEGIKRNIYLNAPNQEWVGVCGMPNARVSHITYQTGSNKIVAAVYGRGVYVLDR